MVNDDNNLVGGWALPLWKMMEWKSVGMMTFPTEWKKKIGSKSPTRQYRIWGGCSDGRYGAPVQSKSSRKNNSERFKDKNGGVPEMGVLQIPLYISLDDAGWFIMENPIYKWMMMTIFHL